MATLADVLKKARRAVLRQGIAGHDADDLVHEAFLKVEAYQREHEVRSQEALLVRAAVNLSIDRMRRSALLPLSDGPDLYEIADSAPDAARIVEARSRLRRLAEGLDRLSPRARRILLKRRLDNMSYAEIAAAEDMSVAAVEKQVARATLQLVDWMGRS